MPGRLRPTFRVGSGYDAHRLVEGRPLIICGVPIEYGRGLAGHSDADVGTHALMDVLLGAAGMGDIGELFPDTDQAFAGASSIGLLAAVVARLARGGWSVVNVDVTLVCQEPRLAGYRGRMREALAHALQVDADAVSIKATTTERMGFEGRGEGVGAYAVCLLQSRG